VNVQTAVEVRRGRAIDQPTPGSARLQRALAGPDCGTPAHPRGAGRPAGTDIDLIVDGPSLPAFDRGGLAPNSMTRTVRAQEHNLEAVSGFAVPPGGAWWGFEEGNARSGGDDRSRASFAHVKGADQNKKNPPRSASLSFISNLLLRKATVLR